MNARIDTSTLSHLSNRHLDALEEETIFILREVAAAFERPTLLFSGGKDSLVMLKCAEKAFGAGRIPYPLRASSEAHALREKKDAEQTSPPRLHLHHLQPHIKLMTTGRTADTVGLDREFIRPDTHAAAIGTPDEMDLLIIDRFILHPMEAVNRLSVQLPGMTGMVAHR